jgi:methyl-accepting chemotaxis protein
MRILVADDDPVSRAMVRGILQNAGHEVLAVEDGQSALDALKSPDAPPMMILDWMMPLVDGVEVARWARDVKTNGPIYILLLTAKASKSDVVSGLQAGADDYLIKPFDAGELVARVEAGRRALEAAEKPLAEARAKAQEVADAAKDLGVLSAELNQNAARTHEEVQAVADDTAQERAANIDLVKAMEELHKSIGDIARSVSEAAEISKNADQIRGDTQRRVGHLGDSSSEIGKVTGTITAISEQTKMLALNATIEAARAGEFGRGFAVVANEVKELARSTSDAAKNIAGMIADVKKEAQQAVGSVARLGEAIGEIVKIHEVIVQTVEAESGRLKEIEDAVSKSTQINNRISASMGGVAQGTKEVVLNAAHGLGEASERLNRVVESLRLKRMAES